MTEGACVHFKFFARFILMIQACFLRILPQSRIHSTAPSRREPFSQTHSSLNFYLLSAHRQSLFGTPPLWRSFRHTKRKIGNLSLSSFFDGRAVYAVLRCFRQLALRIFNSFLTLRRIFNISPTILKGSERPMEEGPFSMTLAGISEIV